MAQINYIKDLYENEDLSLREISRRTGHSFRTVQKYAYQENWSVEKLPNLEAENYPNLEKYIPSIDEWMEADRKLPRKQRHTAVRIYRRLVEEQGYQGSYSSVKRYVRKKKYVLKLASEGYLPLAHPSGEGQVDFGESLYYDAQGRECKGYALTVSFPQSNKGYTQFYPSQNQECLLEGLKRVFEHIGGVPPRLRFDNMSTAVVKVLEGGERELTEGFTRFMLHYRFRAEFCNPASGNEKGNVENKVGYSRRNAFVPVPTVSSFEEFNERLWEWCENDAQNAQKFSGAVYGQAVYGYLFVPLRVYVQMYGMFCKFTLHDKLDRCALFAYLHKFFIFCRARAFEDGAEIYTLEEICLSARVFAVQDVQSVLKRDGRGRIIAEV